MQLACIVNLAYLALNGTHVALKPLCRLLEVEAIRIDRSETKCRRMLKAGIWMLLGHDVRYIFHTRAKGACDRFHQW